MWRLIHRVFNIFLRVLGFGYKKAKTINSALFWGSFGKRELGGQKSKNNYDNENIARNYLERYYEKEKEFGERERQLLLPVFYCLNKFKRVNKYSNFMFADLGGGLGLHFEMLKDFLNHEDIHSYYIIETNSICKVYYNNPLLHNDNRKLFYTLENFPFDAKIDIFLIIGSLQYMDNWKYALQKILSSATFIIMDRLPLIDGDIDVLSTQYVRPPIYDRSTSYPITYIAKSNLESEIKKAGLRIDFFHEDKISQSSLNWKYVKNYTYVVSRQINLVAG